MPLPQSILEMAAVIGLPAALALVKSYGGLELRVPIGRVVEGKVRSDLIALIGPDAADRLILAYGGRGSPFPAVPAPYAINATVKFWPPTTPASRRASSAKPTA